MLILGLLGMYFDAAVVFVTNSSLLFRLAVAILWDSTKKTADMGEGGCQKSGKIADVVYGWTLRVATALAMLSKEV